MKWGAAFVILENSNKTDNGHFVKEYFDIWETRLNSSTYKLKKKDV